MKYIHLVPLLLSLVNLSASQTDFRDFISIPDKFSSRSFSQSNPPSVPRPLRPAARRNVFFPPPDRLSPTLRPILSHQGVVVTTSKPTTALSKFHPSNVSKFSPTPKKESKDDYEEVYYDYYEYLYDEQNTTERILEPTTDLPFVVVTSKPLISEPKFKKPPKPKVNNPPTAFSKFHAGTFRFNSPTKETAPRKSEAKRTTTKSPFRFRFTAPNQRDRGTRPPPTVSKTSNRKSSLADLLSQLSNKNDNPSNNDVDSDRKGRTVQPKTTKQSIIQTTRPTVDITYRITNTTDSTFAVASIRSSQSIVNKEPHTEDSIGLSQYAFTTQESFFDITEDSSDLRNFLDSDVQTTSRPVFSRSEGKRLLDKEPPEENLTQAVFEAEGPTLSKPFSSLFENIQIAVDPSLLPPGYAVEDSLTDNIQDIPVTQTTTSLLVSDLTQSDISKPFENIFSSLPQDDATSLLPPGYTSSNDIIQTTERSFYPAEEDKDRPDTSDVNSKANKSEKISVPVKQVDLASFLPPGYKPNEKTEEKLSSTLITKVDVSSFLPPGFGPKPEKDDNPLSGSSISTVDISKFQPRGFKHKGDSRNENKPAGIAVKKVDASSFLPPGFKPKQSSENSLKAPQKPLIPTVKVVDVSNFLPPGFSSEVSANATTEATPTTRKVGKFGIVFPRRPKRPEYLTTTTTTNKPKISGPPPLKPKIQNLFDRIKALGSTEYKVPTVTEKMKPKDEIESASTSTTTTTTTTTTPVPTTTTPPRPTTPGVCGTHCRLAASLRLVSGTEWKPELANRDTFEFQILSNQIENELDAFYRSSSLSLWYEYVEVDSFNRGSVIVSYILSLSHIEADLDTIDLKERMNLDLERLSHSLGNFTVDPKGTDFSVILERQVLSEDDGQNFLIPEWLIAVIVIGLASFLFILIFGVVALVSRARVRKRANVPLTEEFLNNLNALQVNGIDNYAMNGLYDMEPVWNEKYPEKAMKPPSSKGKGYNPEFNVNIYDSWRTDYSGPYTSSSANQSKRRMELEFDGKQFYKDDPYDF